jgi:uncharacterized protein YndB with AHSA1/START domain
MSDLAPSSPTADTVFRTRRLFPHSLETVFRAFAQPERLARWWGLAVELADGEA